MTVVSNDGGKGSFDDSWNIGEGRGEKQTVIAGEKQGWRGGQRERERQRGMRAGLKQTVRLKNHTRAVFWKNRLPLPASTAPPPRYGSRGPAQSYRCISPPVPSHTDPINAQSVHSQSGCLLIAPYPSPVLQVNPCLSWPKCQRSNPAALGCRSSSNALPLAPFPWML